MLARSCSRAPAAGTPTIRSWRVSGRPSRPACPVVVCSRCVAGRVEPVYGRGGGRDLADAGALFAGDLAGPKARVLLQLALGAGLDAESALPSAALAVRPLPASALCALALTVGLGRDGGASGPEVNVSEASGRAERADRRDRPIERRRPPRRVEQPRRGIDACLQLDRRWRDLGGRHDARARPRAGMRAAPAIRAWRSTRRGRQYYSYLRATPCESGEAAASSSSSRAAADALWSRPVRVAHPRPLPVRRQAGDRGRHLRREPLTEIACTSRGPASRSAASAASS